jgi:hypothetical protein
VSPELEIASPAAHQRDANPVFAFGAHHVSFLPALASLASSSLLATFGGTPSTTPPSTLDHTQAKRKMPLEPDALPR